MSLKNKIHQQWIRTEACGDLSDRTVKVTRVAKVVKGGKRFSFSALVVSGDGRGHVGLGLGKAGEAQEAARKGGEKARKTMVKIPLIGTTIPHEVLGRSGATRVLLRPAPPGTGVIAGSVVRSVIDMAGIKDIRTKCIGSSNANNVLRATLTALLQLKEPKLIAERRGVTLEAIKYHPYEK
jgi:small subunit ribosomal protein S5